MAPINAQYKVNQEELKQAADRVKNKVSDLTIPLTSIAQRWYKNNRAIFQLKSKGKYEDLSEPYKQHKLKEWGFVYPILMASGALALSLTQRGGYGGINFIANKNTLYLGTAISYAQHLQYGTKYMPSRPPVLIAAGRPGAAEELKEINIWQGIINNYILQETDKVFRTPY